MTFELRSLWVVTLQSGFYTIFLSLCSLYWADQGLVSYQLNKRISVKVYFVTACANRNSSGNYRELWLPEGFRLCVFKSNALNIHVNTVAVWTMTHNKAVHICLFINCDEDNRPMCKIVQCEDNMWQFKVIVSLFTWKGS